MKVCGIVIWYNPTENEVENIKSYCEDVDEVFVIDNSDSDNSFMLNNILNIKYIPNFKNLGIAKALNIGCEKAIDNGYEWALTMDQDSSFNKGAMKEYIDKSTKLIEEEDLIAIFAPVTTDIEVEGYIDRVITSGNLLNLNAYKLTGGFDDKLFIDEVDFDFCFRLINKKYKIYKFSDIKLNHKLGDSKKVKFLNREFECMNHNYVRKYYIIRNRMYVMDKYPEYTSMYKKSNWMDVTKVILGEEDKVRRLIYMIKGYCDHKRKKYGKL